MTARLRSADLMGRRRDAQPRQPSERWELEVLASRDRRHSEIPLEPEEQSPCHVMARRWKRRLRPESAQPLPSPIGFQLWLRSEPAPGWFVPPESLAGQTTPRLLDPHAVTMPRSMGHLCVIPVVGSPVKPPTETLRAERSRAARSPIHRAPTRPRAVRWSTPSSVFWCQRRSSQHLGSSDFTCGRRNPAHIPDPANPAPHTHQSNINIRRRSQCSESHDTSQRCRLLKSW